MTGDGKLVRNRIPDIIRSQGRPAHASTLGETDYRTALHAKLREEAAELAAAPPDQTLGELADLYEVLRALTDAHGHTLPDVIAAAATKRAERGGFDHRVWLARNGGDPR